MGRLVKQQQYRHSYPHCWRTETPLIYKAVSSFFVKVTAIKDKMIENNRKITWVPEHMGKKRFHLWLKGAKDWGISRTRVFGTPIPVWVSDDGEEMVCIGSIDELVKKANLTYHPKDLHLDSIQHITIPSSKGKGKLKLVMDIFDCWYESGCVPYGQLHYPFENKNAFKDKPYISDFICEGSGQIRGWFYTLLVLSTALFDKPPFKNVICSGLIMSHDGSKMSKSKMNFTHPMKVLATYGSDPMRLYMISSKAANAGEMKFDEKDIPIVTNKLNQYYNGYKFLLVHLIKFYEDKHKFDPHAYKKSINSMDVWIISRTHSLIDIVKELMMKYHVHKIKGLLFNFIEDLTNWYIKFNRQRFKGKNCKLVDQTSALSTLYYVTLQFVKICSPFMPFLTERMYQKLKLMLPENEQKLSVHHCLYPTYKTNVDENMLRKVKRLQEVSSVVRMLRNKTPASKSVRVSLSKITIHHNNNAYIADIKELERYLKEAINCITIKYDKLANIKYILIPNNRTIGKKYRKLSKKIKAEIIKIDSTVVKQYLSGGKLNVTVDNTIYTLEDDEVKIKTNIDFEPKPTEVYHLENDMMVVVNHKHTQEVKDLYTKRMFIRAIQEMRKEGRLQPWDKIAIYYDTKDVHLLSVVKKYKNDIETTLFYNIYPANEIDDRTDSVIKKECSVDGKKVCITINRV
jgi:isoleucyl-tRNA synthetase